MITLAAIIGLVATSPLATVALSATATEFVELVASELAVQITVDQAQKVIDHFREKRKE